MLPHLPWIPPPPPTQPHNEKVSFLANHMVHAQILIHSWGSEQGFQSWSSQSVFPEIKFRMGRKATENSTEIIQLLYTYFTFCSHRQLCLWLLAGLNQLLKHRRSFCLFITGCFLGEEPRRGFTRKESTSCTR